MWPRSFPRRPAASAAPSPGLGEHNDEIYLRLLGLSAQTVRAIEIAAGHLMSAGLQRAHLELGKCPALIVIDFVKAYVTPGSALYADFEAPRLATVQLLDACRRKGILIIHTQVAYQPGGADGGVFFRKLPALRCFDPSVHPELVGFAAGLQPRPGEVVITKQYASAFFGTTLAVDARREKYRYATDRRRDYQRLHPRHRGRQLPARIHSRRSA